jgi:YVTN family beta-propeller protein
MRRDWIGAPRTDRIIGSVAGVFALLVGGAVVAPGCSDDERPSTSSNPTTSSSSATGGGQGGMGGTGGAGGAGGMGGSGGTGGAGPEACKTPASGSTRGAAIAVSADDSIIVAVNRDAGSVTVVGVDYASGTPALTKKAEIAVGGEPWQVAIDGCGDKAYVVLRKDQKVVEITDLKGAPTKGKEVAVGSEPTAIAITPNNTSLYVANWVDGTLSVIDPVKMAAVKTVDLNATLAGSGLLGASVSAATARPALAHPRSLAITNDGDANDEDENVYVTEFFAQRSEPEIIDAMGKSNVDTNWVGVVYKVEVGDGSATLISLPPLVDTGFPDAKGPTGCFPNQLQSITIQKDLAYVTSICASPAGPVGAFQQGACTTDAQCGVGLPGSCFQGSCKGTCLADADCGMGSPAGTCDLGNGGACKPIANHFKTLVHPVVNILNTKTDMALGAPPINLNKAFVTYYEASAVPDDATRRLPLVANDVAFVGATGEAYVPANGADAVFRVSFDAQSGAVTSVGAGDKRFIDLAPPNFADSAKGQNPIGVAVAHAQPFAFVANDISRNVSAIAITPDKQAVAGEAGSPSVISTAEMPSGEGLSVMRGKRLFNTGLGRWSLRGQAWSSCQTCHIDGLSDNVTWYFARGPRQSNSIEGTFASKDPNDQRIFNWGGLQDEAHDNENTARGIQGGVGALVSTDSNPPVTADRINLGDAAKYPPAGASALNGSAKLVNDNDSVRKDLDDWKAYAQSVRSPRKPTNLDPARVAAGEQLFTAAGKCEGCHGGAKWTLSRRFYTPSGATNEALLTKAYDGAALVAAGFPAALLPAQMGSQFMRSPNPKNGNLDQIQCVLRPVGTFGVSPPDVNVIEVRANMMTKAQGDEMNGKGFNVPSILGMSVGAPYFHAGNARTLEELFASLFDAHTKALAVDPGTFLGKPEEVQAMVAFVLSIDEDTPVIPLPATPGPGGGDFCAAP